MLHIICALKPEAQPLIDYYRLQLQPKAGAFQIYHRPETDSALTISGMGKSAAGAAVNATRDYFKSGKSDAWVNVGTAGHASLPIGQAVITKKITDAGAGQTWFPSRVFTTALPVHELLTLDKPGREYRTELFDMEGAGFFQAVTKFATLELVQVIKIISDNASQSIDEINPDLLSRLITKNLPVIDEVIQQLLPLSKKQQQLERLAEGFDRIVQSRHFTASQRHQLKTLLRKWNVLYRRETLGQAPLEKRLAGQNSATQVLDYLRDELDKAPVNLR